MPAVSFFALLNEGYRLQSYDYLTLATISDLPKMTKQNRKKFYDRLEFAATHPGDILKPSGDGDDPARIKKLLGG